MIFQKHFPIFEFTRKVPLFRLLEKSVHIHAFLYKQHFYKQRQAEIGKKSNAKQHPETERLLFENYSQSSSTLSSKNNRTYPKK